MVLRWVGDWKLQLVIFWCKALVELYWRIGGCYLVCVVILAVLDASECFEAARFYYNMQQQLQLVCKCSRWSDFLNETSLMWLILLLNFIVFDCGPKYIKHHWTAGLWDWISWITDSQSIYFSCHKQRCLGIDSLGYDIHWSCAPSTIFKKVWRKKLKAWNGFSPAAHDDLKGELE